MRQCARRYSNQRASRGLPEYLASSGVVAISGVDTRAITRRLRTTGAMRGVISTEMLNDEELVALARSAPTMSGLDLATEVMPSGVRRWKGRGQSQDAAQRPFNIVAIDCGIKRSILGHLADIGGDVLVVPGTARAATILARRPDGVLVGNGPGDPETVTATIQTLRDLVGRVPLFGVCLGHQMLALALGARTYKLKFGHHGANHPVLNTAT